MGIKEKQIIIPHNIVEQIRYDFDGNMVKIYNIDEVPDVFVNYGILHPEVAKKSQSFVTAVSGSNSDSKDYLLMSALRLDHSGQQYVTDMDPLILVYQSEYQSAGVTGIIQFHGDFEGRTQQAGYSIQIPISTIQNQVTSSGVLFEESDPRFANAMRHMENAYNNYIKL